MTPEAFTDWLRGAREGHSVAYYEGFLALDRWLMGEAGTWLYYKPNPEVSRVGLRAWRAYEARYVHLTQQRVSDGLYVYIATRTNKRIARSWNDQWGTAPATPDAIPLRHTPTSGGRILHSIRFNPPRL